MISSNDIIVKLNDVNDKSYISHSIYENGILVKGFNQCLCGSYLINTSDYNKSDMTELTCYVCGERFHIA